MSHPRYNQERNFKRGEVYMVDFSAEPKKFGQESRTIEGLHRAVVLFDSDFPRKTVVVVPISSLYSHEGEKDTISSDVILRAENYQNHQGSNAIHNNTILVDSFAMTNQLTSVSRNYLESQKGKLVELDMVKLDLQLINVLSLQDTIERLVEEEVESRLEAMGLETESTTSDES